MERSEGQSGVHVERAQLMRLRHVAQDISFLPRQPLSSLLAGRHASRLRGRGLNFEEIRGYRPGDDTRNMDWKATARLRKPQVRVYTEERDRVALFVVDQRQSMFFGSRHQMKSVAAAQMAALGAWRALDQGDRPGAILFNDATTRYIRPQRSAGNVTRLLEELTQLNGLLGVDNPAPAEPGMLNQALERALRAASHDQLVVVISDFVGLDHETERLLKLISRHNDVIAVLVRDPLEIRLPHAGRLAFESDGLQLEVDTASSNLRARFTQRFQERLASGQVLLSRLEIPLLQVTTERDVIAQVREQLLGTPGAR